MAANLPARFLWLLLGIPHPELRHAFGLRQSISYEEENAASQACSVHPSQAEIDVFLASVFLGKPKFREYLQQPVGIFMVGGPGSGKSVVQQLGVMQTSLGERDFVLIDPDQVLMALYLKSNGEPDMRCYKPEIEKIRMMVFDKALSENHSFIMDGTGKNFSAWSRLSAKAQNAGFETRAAVAMVEVSVALSRIESRARATGRNVDLDYAERAHNKVMSNLEDYTNSNRFHVVEVYENSVNGQSPSLALRSGSRVLHPESVSPGAPQSFCDLRLLQQHDYFAKLRELCVKLTVNPIFAPGGYAPASPMNSGNGSLIIYDGAFSPPHMGHKAVADGCLRLEGLPKPVKVIVNVWPHDDRKRFVWPQMVRLDLAKAHFGDLGPNLVVSDFYIKKSEQEKRYISSAEAVNNFRNQFPGFQIFLSGGSDHFTPEHFLRKSPKEVKARLMMYDGFVIFCRLGESIAVPVLRRVLEGIVTGDVEAMAKARSMPIFLPEIPQRGFTSTRVNTLLGYRHILGHLPGELNRVPDEWNNTSRIDAELRKMLSPAALDHIMPGGTIKLELAELSLQVVRASRS